MCANKLKRTADGSRIEKRNMKNRFALATHTESRIVKCHASRINTSVAQQQYAQMVHGNVLYFLFFFFPY